MPPQILILGAGITGLTTALALHQTLPIPKPAIKTYEIRPSPSTIGGAVNLTPKALRYLSHLGVLDILLRKGYGAECKCIELFNFRTGGKFAEVSFQGPEGLGIGGSEEGRFFSRRVERWQLQEVLLEACAKVGGIDVVFGKKTVGIEEFELEEGHGGVRLRFADGEVAEGDLLIAADGIHSVARTLLVDPERRPRYTGVSAVMTRVKLRSGLVPRWETTGWVSSQRGSLMCSYVDSEKEEQYMAAVMEIAEVENREGWRARGSDQKALKQDLLDRFTSDTMPELATMIEDAGEWSLYPVYVLPGEGKWISPGGKCILVGDAAHAMAPQGESTGICIEDAIVLSRALLHHQDKSLSAIFAAYERFRRPYIEGAVKQATQRWETVKDGGWLMHQVKCFLTPWVLWWTAAARDREFAEDLSELDLEV